MKNITIRFGFFALITFLIGVLISCENNEDEYTHFRIQIDGINCPDTIEANRNYEITFEGIIGVSACSLFDKFKTEKTEDGIRVEAWGKFKNREQACPLYIPQLNTHIYVLKVSDPGEFIIIGNNLNGEDLIKKIVVE